MIESSPKIRLTDNQHEQDIRVSKLIQHAKLYASKNYHKEVEVVKLSTFLLANVGSSFFLETMPTALMVGGQFFPYTIMDIQCTVLLTMAYHPIRTCAVLLTTTLAHMYMCNHGKRGQAATPSIIKSAFRLVNHCWEAELAEGLVIVC